jgi:hypothetical protein
MGRFIIGLLMPLASGLLIPMPLIDQAGLDILNYVFSANQAKVQQILQHGCWCAKLDPAQTSSELGGSAIDKLDGLCHMWFKSRKCSVEFGNECTDAQIGWLGYKLESNVCTDAPQDPNAPDATYTCQAATCNIDAYHAAAIYKYVTDNNWDVPVAGNSGNCLKNGHGKSCQGYPFEEYTVWTLP